MKKSVITIVDILSRIYNRARDFLIPVVIIHASNNVCFTKSKVIIYFLTRLQLVNFLGVDLS